MSEVRTEPEAHILAERHREREFVAFGLPLNLQVLGFIEESPRTRYLILMLPAFGLMMQVDNRPLRWLSALVVSAICFDLVRSVNPRWRWSDAGGANRHLFVGRMESLPLRGWLRKTPRDTWPWETYLQQPIWDPNMGQIECDFRYEDSTASAGCETVFRIQRKPKRIPRGIPGDALAKWHGTFRVLADARLHPDTMEALVERFVLKKNDLAARAYLINRELDGGKT